MALYCNRLRIPFDARIKQMDRGFTLIELMITVAIVAILATIAYPSYRNYLLRSHRAEARNALLQIQVAQEKYFLQNNSYVTTDAVLAAAVTASPPGLGIATTTANGYYSVSLGTAGTANTYTATATATGGQLSDTKCKTFGVNNLGAKTATDSGGADSMTTCWSK